MYRQWQFSHILFLPPLQSKLRTKPRRNNSCGRGVLRIDRFPATCGVVFEKHEMNPRIETDVHEHSRAPYCLDAGCFSVAGAHARSGAARVYYLNKTHSDNVYISS